MNGIITGTTTLGKSGPGSNDNEEVLHTPPISKNGASPPDAVLCHTQDSEIIGYINSYQLNDYLYVESYCNGVSY